MPPSVHRDTYAELLTTAFTEAEPTSVDVVDTSEVTAAIVRSFDYQRAVSDLVQQIDWESTGLMPHRFRVPNADDLSVPETLAPREYAERLMMFAFDDPREIIMRADDFLRQSGENQPGEVLKRSKGLLQISRLSDSNKNHVLQSTQFPDVRSHMSHVPQFEGPAFVLQENKNGDKVLEWNEEIKLWIKTHLEADRGCPAWDIVITKGNRKTTLLSYFWERLISYIYDVD